MFYVLLTTCWVCDKFEEEWSCSSLLGAGLSPRNLAWPFQPPLAAQWRADPWENRHQSYDWRTSIRDDGKKQQSASNFMWKLPTFGFWQNIFREKLPLGICSKDLPFWMGENFWIFHVPCNSLWLSLGLPKGSQSNTKVEKLKWVISKFEVVLNSAVVLHILGLLQIWNSQRFSFFFAHKAQTWEELGLTAIV